VFEAAARGGVFVHGQCSEVFGQFIIGDLFGQAAKMQADEGNSAQIVVEGTLALPAQDDLLLEDFVNFLKAINRQNGFFNNCRFVSFFS
jgi:hypothetical protein